MSKEYLPNHYLLFERQQEIRSYYEHGQNNVEGKRAIVCMDYPPKSDGGTQRTTAALSNHLTEEGVEVLLIYPDKKRLEFEDSNEVEHAQHYRIQITSREDLLKRAPSEESCSMIRSLVGGDVDAIILSSPEMLGLSVLRYMDGAFKERVVVTWNSPINISLKDIGVPSDPHELEKILGSEEFYSYREERWRASGITELRAVFNSYTNQDAFQATFPSANPHEKIVIPPTSEFCHECDVPRTGAEAIRADLNGSFVVLTTGRATARKGTERVFEIAKGLNSFEVSDFPERITFLITGDFREEYVQALVRRSDEFNAHMSRCEVVVLDRPKDSGLCNLYKNSDLFFIPSGIEGFGLVTIEAASHGLPVVGVNNRGSAELIPFFREWGKLVNFDTNNRIERESLVAFQHFVSQISNMDHFQRDKMAQQQTSTALVNFSPPVINKELLRYVFSKV